MKANWSTTMALALLISTAPAMAQTPQPTLPDPADTGQTKEVVPEPEGTGWATLIKDTGRDFASFPRRKSTWVLLAGGAAAALAVHPADDYVQSHIVGNANADRFFRAGQILGSAGFHVGYQSPSQFSRDYGRLFGLPPARDAMRLRTLPV